tara:strand:- start:3509 stop:3949 length:441 start_codon:yes stop_codon:yes gene_type:complete
MPSITFTDEAPRSDTATLPQTLEKGEYELRIKDYEFRTSKAGNEIINLMFEEKESKKYIWDNLVFTPKAQWKIKQFLGAIEKEVGKSANMDESFMNDIVGEHLWVEVGTDSYGGKTKNTIEKYLSGKARSKRQVIDDEDVPSWDKN